MFSEPLLDHFQNPRNAGELADAHRQIEVRNPVCGDILQLAVNLEAGRISEVRFLCRGCTASIACASVLTEKMKGAEPAALGAVTALQISDGLGGLPPATYHAAQLAEDGLKALLRALNS